jgi:Spy/CpxP family protein refolding chaperone
MKLPGIALATLAIAALVGGTAAAQVTMQPVPNPPEKAKPMGHHHWRHHHGHHHGMRHHHHHMKAAPAEAAAPAPAPPSK